MKIFISWSGNLGKRLAEILKQWLPSVIQAVKPYYSPDDVTKGTRWSAEIAKELEESRVGLICLTKDSLLAPWILFEAGALSKNIDKSRVCPVLFGVNPTDIQGPMVQFQAAKFEEKDIKRVILMINSELGDRSLSPDVLESCFEMWWPILKEKIEIELQKNHATSENSNRSEKELLEEILQLTRNISQTSLIAINPYYSVNPHVFHYNLPSKSIDFDLPEEGINFYELEEQLLKMAMAKSNGVVAKAAKLLGMSYKTFWYRWGIINQEVKTEPEAEA